MSTLCCFLQKFHFTTWFAFKMPWFAILMRHWSRALWAGLWRPLCILMLWTSWEITWSEISLNTSKKVRTHKQKSQLFLSLKNVQCSVSKFLSASLSGWCDPALWYEVKEGGFTLQEAEGDWSQEFYSSRRPGLCRLLARGSTVWEQTWGAGASDPLGCGLGRCWFPLGL